MAARPSPAGGARRRREPAGAPTVHLVDAHAYVFRAYHALPAMQAPDGTPTAAAYGFTSTLLKYLAEEAPTHVGVAFDASLTSFRNDLEPGYKQGRTEAPEDLEPQLPLCVEAARVLGLAAYAREPFEADDLIGTLVAEVLARGARAVVVSPDKDLTQLVTEDGRVELYDLARGITLDAQGVRSRFGVPPARIPDYLGLVGDAVDNLPGVPGVGPKTAAALLAAFGSIERIPADPSAWSGVAVRGAARLAARVEAHRERARKTRSLAIVRRDVPGLDADLATLAWRGPRLEPARALFERLGWTRMRERLTALG